MNEAALSVHVQVGVGLQALPLRGTVGTAVRGCGKTVFESKYTVVGIL